MSSQYKYKPLAPGDIRILQIRPGRRNSPIKCCLQTYNLQTNPNIGYTALSYVWGPNSCPNTLLLNDCSFPVTHNLHSALQHMRDRKKRLSLWVDAVCINQADNDERGHQVAHMRSIYRCATRVTIWLGEADETSDGIMDYLRYEVREEDIPTPAVMDLFCRSWWSRIWVVQEAASARHDPVFRCGDRELPWTCLHSLQTKVPFTGWMQYVMEFRDPSRMSIIGKYHAMIHMQMIFAAVNRIRSGTPLPWRDSLALGYVMESTDPRDLTYALMGLLDNQGAIPTSPDYQKDVALVRREAAALEIQRSNGLESLTFTSSLSPKHLPTWVSDMANGEPGIFITADTSIYKAANGTDPHVWWSDEYKILHASGMICDTVIDVVHGRIKDSAANKRTFDRARHLAYAFGKANGFESSVTKDRFWRTMIMNQGRPRFGSPPADIVYPAPDDLGRRYMAWQKEIAVPDEAIGPGLAFEWELEYIKPYFASHHGVSETEKWTFFTTKSARFGLGQQGIMVGDLVCILCGGRVVYILREEREHHILVGCAYVHGIMDGELAPDLNDQDRIQEFEIH